MSLFYRYVSILALAPLALAQQPDARAVLQKMSDAYKQLSAIHIVAERHGGIQARQIQLPVSLSVELAIKAPAQHRVVWRSFDEEGVTVSNGTTTWRALPKTKQWTKLAVSSLGGDDADQDADSGAVAGQLSDKVTKLLVSRYIAIARYAVDAVIVKEDNYSMKQRKARCWVVRTRAGNSSFELWIDQQTALVLRDVHKGPMQTQYGKGESSIDTRVKLLETGDAVSNDLFHYEPDRTWTQVRELILPEELTTMMTGTAAADFTLATLTGEQIHLKELRGQVVVLDFWATWCPPCREELPTIAKLSKEFAGSVRVLGVNDEAEDTVRSFMRAKGYTFDVVLDARRAVTKRYGVHSIPNVMVIDRNGVIREHFIGSRGEKELRAAIEGVLRTGSSQ